MACFVVATASFPCRSAVTGSCLPFSSLIRTVLPCPALAARSVLPGPCTFLPLHICAQEFSEKLPPLPRMACEGKPGGLSGSNSMSRDFSISYTLSKNWMETEKSLREVLHPNPPSHFPCSSVHKRKDGEPAALFEFTSSMQRPQDARSKHLREWI